MSIVERALQKAVPVLYPPWPEGSAQRFVQGLVDRARLHNLAWYAQVRAYESKDEPASDWGAHAAGPQAVDYFLHLIV